MIPVSLGEIATVLNAEIVVGTGSEKVSGVTIDSRHVQEGDLFVAIKGEQVDGHQYVSDALAKGAFGALVTNDIFPSIPGTLLRVQDTKKALIELATWYRKNLHLRIVGVTGSVGKTTTKEMIAAVLAEKYNVHKNKGNYNTEIGVPLTLLELNESHEIAVIEMAMRGLGQIKQLGRMSSPFIGVITNIDVTHLEVLGTMENIARAKGELLQELPRDGGIAILNGDDKRLRELARNFSGELLFYGLGENNHYRGLDVRVKRPAGTTFTVVTPNGEATVKLTLPGKHNVMNALAAIAVGDCFGLSLPTMVEGLKKLKSVTMRLDTIVRGDGLTIINDAYNANPTSMGIALDILKDFKENGRTIAVLGDMLELGPVALTAHRDIGRKVAELGIDLLIALGDWREEIITGARDGGMKKEQCLILANKYEAVEHINKFASPGDVVLVKASRGLGLEQLVYELAKENR